MDEALKDKTKKRKANKLEEDEDSNLDLESEIPSLSDVKLQPRRKHAPSTYSDYTTDSSHSYDTTSSNDEVIRDSNNTLGSPRFESKEDGNYSASEWKYADLEFLNIFYEKTPESLENFMREVKDTFRERKGVCPDPSIMTNVLKKHLENLTFSYDLTYLRDLRMYGNCAVTNRAMKEMEKYLQWTWKKSQEMLEQNQLYQALDSSMKEKAQELIFSLSFPMKAFAGETIQLVRKILYGKQEEKQSSSGETERGKGKKRVRYRGSHGQHADSESSYMATTDKFFKQYCEKFGGLFFLVTGEVLQRSFSFKNRVVRSTPDVVYHYLADTWGGYPPDELFFIVEAKNPAVFEEGATYMEKLVGQNIMGQVGADLLGRSSCSVFYPNCLGIIRVETQLIFVLLKISKEHSIGIRKGERGSADDPGKIIYTEPFDILKSEDRLKMAEFLYWLGFVQDLRKYDFL